jgi:hypothetical protein
MKQIHIILTDRDRYFLTVLFSLAGCLAKGQGSWAAALTAIETADNIKKLTQHPAKDEQ